MNRTPNIATAKRSTVGQVQNVCLRRTYCTPCSIDLDCADIRALGIAPVRVIGSDPHRLDGDHDGWGCE